ncbi:MAG: DNA polymerase III subunit gamma/tau [Planctomycetota bacterium]|jgi:DNA polymerase-3 subunit gamma/tau|nr:DNA polymerase III subunit gamma/tau [Planctomycetota bacterium]MDP6988264.1 DNA polymerase III subunit gamma/tau [Planctomycetota bacterium]
MSYLVLARKYRPRRFAEIIGQEVVCGTLRGAIEEGRIAHAYLLCGSRGTGKTTIARIFARGLNCEAGPTADPCGDCECCRAAEEGSDVDIVEIDAASHTGVDNIRDLRDQATYVPMRARHKIYIVDEVHMLSKGAFNALLKTLEEPPPHVKFVFATTEPHKVLDTILSRCQVLRLSLIAEATIRARLEEILAGESVEAQEGVCEALARRARGSMRDALSLTDQLLALAGERPTLEDIARLCVGADPECVAAVFAALVAGDAAAALAALTEGADDVALLDELLARLRSCLLVAHCGVQTPLVDLPPEERAALAEQAEAIGGPRIELLLDELIAARDRAGRVPGEQRLVLELALCELCRPEATVPVGELIARLEALEARLGGAQAPVGAPAAAAAAAPAQPAPPAAPARRGSGSPETVRAARPAAPAPRAVHSSVAETWKALLAELAERLPSLAEVLERRGRLVELDTERAVVHCDGLRAPERALVSDERNRKRCSQALSGLLERPIEVELVDLAGVPAGEQDDFTGQVADLFGGRIEN